MTAGFFSGRVCAGFLMAAVFAGAVSAHAADPAPPPNVVFILLDDAGYGDLGCYGQEKFGTPQIDRLAAEGMRFTQHYAGSTVCAPTRSVLMTGLHTGHTPVRGNREVQPIGQHPLPAESLTLPEALAPAGIVSGGFGKWGLGFPGSEGAPTRQGFERFFGYNCQRAAHSYRPAYLFDNDEKVDHDPADYSHDVIMRRSRDWVRGKAESGESFFLFLPVTIPHAAMDVPEDDAAPWREKFAQFEGKIGRYGGTETRNPAAMFAGMMTRLDRDVGRLLDLLEELGIAQNTLVMLSSDNGPHQEGGHMPDFFNSNGGFRGHKRDLTEGGIRVPLLARWPGRIEAGAVSNHISAQWDVFPTVCEAVGAEVPDGLDGISFLPTLTGRPDEQRDHEYLYWEFGERGGKRAARFGESGQWKAIQRDLMKEEPGPVLLFDLLSDPDESENIAGAHPDQVARAQEIFRDAHIPSEFWPFPFD